jgi:hypothetical protein
MVRSRRIPRSINEFSARKLIDSSYADITTHFLPTMKWKTFSVCATYLVIGLGGFMLGKLAGGNADSSERDRLSQKSGQLSHQRSDSASRENANRPNRPNRPSQRRDHISLDKKLADLNKIPPGPQNALARGRALHKLVDSLAPDEFEAAVDGVSCRTKMILLSAWAEVNPAAALAYTIGPKADNFDLETSHFTRSEATSNVLSAWAGRDPEAAIAWANSHHHGEEANPYMLGIIRGIAESDPARAAALLNDLPFGYVRGDALLTMVPHVMKMGPEYVKQWIADIPDERLRQGAVYRFSIEMATQDPAGAVAYLLNNPSDRAMGAVFNVIGDWAKLDPAAAIASVESLPEGATRQRALDGIVFVVTPNNTQAAADLMNRFAGEMSDMDISFIIARNFDESPDWAANQIERIQNEKTRQNMYVSRLHDWLLMDEAAAQNWINSANLPASVIESLESKKAPGGENFSFR